MSDETPPDNVTPIKRKPGTKPHRRPGSATGPTSGKRVIEMSEQQSKALALRLAGANLVQIADELGYASAAGARVAVMGALKIILPDELREDARAYELAVINRLQMAHWQPALAGDDKAATVVLRCVKMRREMLGLDAPAQVQVTLYEGEPVQIDVLQQLDEDTLAAARGLRSQMQELAKLKAGAINTTGSG